ncbi:unnamed protein product [Clavelina lepadiformis]|uniref:Uncharacterized protein n=1 Tax=Clavelina lepadiformis TaxID=159417 RepID=A0ABP0GUJ5_CLALP
MEFFSLKRKTSAVYLPYRFFMGSDFQAPVWQRRAELKRMSTPAKCSQCCLTCNTTDGHDVGSLRKPDLVTFQVFIDLSHAVVEGNEAGCEFAKKDQVQPVNEIGGQTLRVCTRGDSISHLAKFGDKPVE